MTKQMPVLICNPLAHGLPRGPSNKHTDSYNFICSCGKWFFEANFWLHQVASPPDPKERRGWEGMALAYCYDRLDPWVTSRPGAKLESPSTFAFTFRAKQSSEGALLWWDGDNVVHWVRYIWLTSTVRGRSKPLDGRLKEVKAGRVAAWSGHGLWTGQPGCHWQWGWGTALEAVDQSQRVQAHWHSKWATPISKCQYWSKFWAKTCSDFTINRPYCF